MKAFFKKLVSVLPYVLLFLGYAYILFINIMCPPEIRTQSDAIRRLVLALVLSIGMPGIMCILLWQNRNRQ